MNTIAALTTPKSAGASSRVRRTSTPNRITAMAPLHHATHAIPRIVRCVRLGEGSVTRLRRIGRPPGRWRSQTSPVASLLWSAPRCARVRGVPKPRRTSARRAIPRLVCTIRASSQDMTARPRTRCSHAPARNPLDLRARAGQATGAAIYPDQIGEGTSWPAAREGGGRKARLVAELQGCGTCTTGFARNGHWGRGPSVRINPTRATSEYTSWP
jgi:hypothetical protein